MSYSFSESYSRASYSVYGAQMASSFSGGSFSSGSFSADDSEPPAPAPTVVPSGARSGRRYRIIEDPDKLLEEVRVEEKKVEKNKKRLVILERRASAPNVEGALYQQIQAKVEKLEAKIDDRLERIAFLMALDFDDEDDEEVMFL